MPTGLELQIGSIEGNSSETEHTVSNPQMDSVLMERNFVMKTG